MEWNDDYLVGVVGIDVEHKVMVDCVSEIEKAVASGDGSALSSAIDRLASHTASHFDFEEKLMRLHNYADVEEHAKGHKKFLAYLKKIRAESGSGPVSDDVVQLLHQWLEDHFTKDDRYYASSLSGKDKELARKVYSS